MVNVVVALLESGEKDRKRKGMQNAAQTCEVAGV
jgi:hypothetical protein